MSGSRSYKHGWDDPKLDPQTASGSKQSTAVIQASTVGNDRPGSTNNPQSSSVNHPQQPIEDSARQNTVPAGFRPPFLPNQAIGMARAASHSGLISSFGPRTTPSSSSQTSRFDFGPSPGPFAAYPGSGTSVIGRSGYQLPKPPPMPALFQNTMSELSAKLVLLESAAGDNEKINAEAKRLREERDIARDSLHQAQLEIAHLQRLLHEASSSRQQVMYRTPEHNQFGAPRQESSRSNASSGSFAASSRAFPASFPQDSPSVRRGSDVSTSTMVRSGLRQSSTQSTPSDLPAKLYQQSITQNLITYFNKVERWAAQYALITPDGPFSDPKIRTIKAKCLILVKHQDMDELLVDDRLRRFLIAAVINYNLNRFLGQACMEGYAQSNSPHLAHIRSELAHTHPTDCRAQHALLQQRAALMAQYLNDPAFSAWLEGRVAFITHEIHTTLLPVIPEAGLQASRADLKKLVKEVFHIGGRMSCMAREWAVTAAFRGERWDPHCMDQRDEGLAGDARLHRSNGFAFVVRCGVSPSVTEKSFEDSAMRIATVHRRSVLLTDNANQRR